MPQHSSHGQVSNAPVFAIWLGIAGFSVNQHDGKAIIYDSGSVFSMITALEKNEQIDNILLENALNGIVYSSIFILTCEVFFWQGVRPFCTIQRSPF